jgi:hypothetical protein
MSLHAVTLPLNFKNDPFPDVRERLAHYRVMGLGVKKVSLNRSNSEQQTIYENIRC